MRPTDFLATALLLSTPCFAWPPRLEDLFVGAEKDVAALVPRATTSYDLSFSAVQGNTATTVPTPAPGSATSGGSGTITGTGGLGSGAANATGSGQLSGGNATSTSAPEFDPRLPAGGVSMITPNPQAAATTYYKIKDWVTFAWNYTSLSVTPSAVDILASCAKNQQTYTIALNQTIPSNGAQTVLWDTGAFQSTATIPLLTETYTLIIHDAQQPVTARASSGYLGTFSGLLFGMYVPESPTPLSGYVCATCSGAMTAIERQTMGVVLVMASLTVFSFTWFTGVAGLW